MIVFGTALPAIGLIVGAMDHEHHAGGGGGADA